MAEYVAADGRSKEIIHTEQHLGDALVRAGILKPYVKPVPRQPNTTWGVGRFLDGKPYIVANCATCKHPQLMHPQHSYSGTNPAQMVFKHCRIHEQPPVEVVAEYVELLNAFVKRPKSKTPRQAPQRVESL
jgi:hypothetical protein